jgi:hypothetical protein
MRYEPHAAADEGLWERLRRVLFGVSEPEAGR